MKRVALFLTAKQIERLQARSRLTGAPVAELIRRAVDSYLDEQEAREKPRKRK
jgi:predicted DNA-binding protein